MPTIRRDFLKGSLLLGGGAAVGRWFTPAVARAQAAEDLYFVFAYFSGGWDILLGLDPRDPGQFPDDEFRQTRIQPGYGQIAGSPDLVRVGDRAFGPYIGEMARHADRLAVVNGLSMETLTHETGRRRFLTGKQPAGLQARGSSASTWLAAQYGDELPIPNLSLRVEAYNTDLPSFASALRANSGTDLVDALSPEGTALALRDEVAALHAAEGDCPKARSSAAWTTAEAGRQKAVEMVDSRLDQLFALGANTPQMEALRDRYGIADRGSLSSPEAQAAIAAQALKGGVSRCVSIQATSGLDTHFQNWATDQGPLQQRGFDSVARLVDDLAASPYGDGGDSWLDHTIILGFSEFSRTPLLNERGGRDHSLTNSCFLIGGGLRAGTYGASSDFGMEPTAVDLATGRPDPGGEVLRPEHVITTLLHRVGVTNDPADLRAAPIAPLLG
jgi:uncharacterized protein (DUF1501 family)